jgi:hypothetical protein
MINGGGENQMPMLDWVEHRRVKKQAREQNKRAKNG